MPAFNQLRLDTPRLTLRPLAHADAASIFPIFSNPETSRFLARGGWKHIDEAHQRIARDINSTAAGDYVRLGIERKEDARIVGELCLFNFGESRWRAELGYALVRDAWGQGFAAEAVAPLVAFAFRELELHRLEAELDPRNVASAKLLQRLGFTREGLLRERWNIRGEISDSALHGLLRRDWEQAQARP